MQLQSPFGVVTGSLDGEVLYALARVDARLTVGQMRAVLGRGSDEGVRKVLRRLSAQGIVESEQIGGSVGYRLNREHLAADAIVAIAYQRDTLMARMRERLESWPSPPLWAALFGSAARGEMRADSDIDLFLVDPGIDADLWEQRRIAFAADVAAWTGNDARILGLSEDEVRLGAAKGDPIIGSLLDDAVTITGPTDWLRTTVRSAR